MQVSESSALHEIPGVRELKLDAQSQSSGNVRNVQVDLLQIVQRGIAVYVPAANVFQSGIRRTGFLQTQLLYTINVHLQVV